MHTINIPMLCIKCKVIKYILGNTLPCRVLTLTWVTRTKAEVGLKDKSRVKLLCGSDSVSGKAVGRLPEHGTGTHSIQSSSIEQGEWLKLQVAKTLKTSSYVTEISVVAMRCYGYWAGCPSPEVLTGENQNSKTWPTI